MSDKFDRPLGTYTNVTEVVSAAAQTQILAQIDVFKNLIQNPATGPSSTTVHTDFDRIPPETAYALRAEIDALKAAIDAAPTA